jgi:sugar phosphate permease
MVRVAVYCLTFFTYASVHMMRTTYSFNKPFFAKQYGLSNLFLGILDSTIFLAMALGTFLRYSILNDKKHTLTLIKTAIPAAIFYIIVPLLSITHAVI